MSIQENLSRPLGPLPAWAWGIVVGGGYLAYRVLTGKSVFPTTQSGVIGSIPSDITAAGSGGISSGNSSNSSTIANTPIDTSGGSSSSGATTTPTATIINPLLASIGGAGLSNSDLAYWTSKVGTDPMDFSNNSYDPATLLARWQMRATAGTSGTALTQQDINIGLAYATARADAAGVTADQLAAARVNIAQYGDAAGQLDTTSFDIYKALIRLTGSTPKLQGDLLTVAPTVNPLTTAETSALNFITGQQGGFTPTNLNKLADLGYTAKDLPGLAAAGKTLGNMSGTQLPAPTTTDSGNAARATQLRAALAQDAIYLANLKKAGKTSSTAYTKDLATYNSNKQQLASLTLPVGTTSGH